VAPAGARRFVVGTGGLRHRLISATPPAFVIDAVPKKTRHICHSFCLYETVSVYPKLIRRNSGMLPDSWRGHFVRVPAQIQNLRGTSGKMPELRPESAKQIPGATPQDF